MMSLARLIPTTLLAGTVALGVSVSAQADVRVRFADPGHFRDADRAGGVLRPSDAFAELSTYLRHLGQRLPAGQNLDVEFLDVNFAGVPNPVEPPPQSTRILDRTTWPSFKLRYRLTENGRTILQNEELVADREYLSRRYTSFDTDPLKYEKNLLDDWFDARFILRQPPRPRG